MKEKKTLTGLILRTAERMGAPLKLSCSQDLLRYLPKSRHSIMELFKCRSITIMVKPLVLQMPKTTVAKPCDRLCSLPGCYMFVSRI